MKKIVHLSDLHFGTERPGVLDVLIDDIKSLKPDMIIVSGDLTQRAKPGQYAAAKNFLNAITTSQTLCVPGNHDISLYNFIERFFYPFAKYKKWISSNLCQYLLQDDFVVLGINSVTPFKPMGGYVTEQQLQLVRDFFQLQPRDKVRIVAMHHNLVRSERHKIINDAEKIINVFAACQVNLVLSGHIHFPHIELLKRSYVTHNMYVVTAGTPISTRTAAPNSFNVLEVSQDHFSLTVRTLTENKFVSGKEEIYPF